MDPALEQMAEALVESGDYRVIRRQVEMAALLDDISRSEVDGVIRLGGSAKPSAPSAACTPIAQTLYGIC
jgi:hypothetical protein